MTPVPEQQVTSKRQTIHHITLTSNNNKALPLDLSSTFERKIHQLRLARNKLYCTEERFPSNVVFFKDIANITLPPTLHEQHKSLINKIGLPKPTSTTTGVYNNVTHGVYNKTTHGIFQKLSHMVITNQQRSPIY